MAAFASFFVDFLWSLIKNIGSFFASIGIAIYKFFIKDVIGYFKALKVQSTDFGALGWICLVIVAIVNTVLVGFIFYRLWQLIRRYFIYRAKDVQKDKLLEEIAKLKVQAEDLAQEKNKIFAQKVNKEVEALLNEEKKADSPIVRDDPNIMRFPTLLEIDKRYEENPHRVYMTDEDMLPLSEIVTRFIGFAASQLNLYYEEDTVRLFFAALATSKIVILEGATSAGKSSLPYAMGRFFNNDTLMVSVTPDWRDRADLIGYYDEFTRRFNETPFLRGIYEASHREDPTFITLDEMNLARAEYYFSDFLALMDIPDASEWKIDLVTTSSSADPKHIIYGKMFVPQNMWYIGTANTDDATFAISDFVYDRAITIEINEEAEDFDEPFTPAYNCSYAYLQSLFDRATIENAISDQNMRRILELEKYINEKFAVPFGTRIMKQISGFVSTYVACGGTEIGGIDFIICSKVLRKFVALNLPMLRKDLSDLIVFLNTKFGQGNMYYSVEYIKILQKVN